MGEEDFKIGDRMDDNATHQAGKAREGRFCGGGKKSSSNIVNLSA